MTKAFILGAIKIGIGFSLAVLGMGDVINAQHNKQQQPKQGTKYIVVPESKQSTIQ